MKARKLFSKVLCSILAAVMLLGMMPVFASATEGDVDLGVEGLVLNKTATLTDDGTYTINLEAFSTGETMTVMTSTPTDVVLVLDVSGSMDDTFKYTLGKSWTSVKDNLSLLSIPNDAYHKCPDGTYHEVSWTMEDYNTTVRYTCPNCYATRKWKTPIGQAIPGEGDVDSWNLWRYTDIITEQEKIVALKNAVNAFMAGVAVKNDAINADEQHRVAIVKFASEKTMSTIGNDTYQQDGYTYNYTQTVAELTPVTSENLATMNSTVNALNAGGATAADKGMDLAESLLNNAPALGTKTRNTVVILFTDGEPNHHSGFDSTVAVDVVSTAKDMKAKGTTVYTIGLFTDANPTDTTGAFNKYLNATSSNFKTASATTNGSSDINVVWGDGSTLDGYYKAVTQSTSLTNIFEEISSSVGTTSVTFDASAELRDVMMDGFVLTDNSTVSVETVEYKGRDKFGNRVFENTPTAFDATVTKDVTNNIVKISGFDYSEEYLLDGTSPDGNDFTAAQDGRKIIVTITGVKATDPAVTNALISTNKAASGLYQNASATIPSALFPQPKTQLSSRTYVLDYAKEIATTDLPNGVTHMDADGMNKFSSPVLALDEDYGDATPTSYNPTTMKWVGYDVYYAFGKWNTDTPTGVTTGDNTWTRVTVMPANNVYYEDTFINTSTDGTTTGTGTVGITYGGEWTVVKGENAGENTETPNTSVHGGWADTDTGLADDNADSDGTIHMSSTKAATATFTFTGTGFDVYSRTNMTSGKVYAKISQIGYREADTDVNGDGEIQGTEQKGARYNVRNTGMIVDTESASSKNGEYYAIPTLWFDATTAENVKKGYTYGEYDVTIKVQNDAEDGADYSYCIDGIRIYNPLGDGSDENQHVSDDVVQEAYGEELNAMFYSVRELLIDTTNAPAVDATAEGALFIDKLTEGQGDTGDVETTPTTTKNILSTYEDYGPKNEVYLGEGQSLVFNVATTGYRYQIGLKAPTGNTKFEISHGDEKADGEVAHSTDMYYEVVPNTDGTIVIRNVDDGKPDTTNLLSVTKIKVLNSSGVAEAFSLRAISVDKAVAAADSFDMMPVVPYSMAPEAPEEPTEPEVPSETPSEPEVPSETPSEPENPTETPTEPEVPTEPETPTEPENKPNIDIQNPTEPEEEKPNGPTPEQVEELKVFMNKLFNAFRGWLKR